MSRHFLTLFILFSTISLLLFFPSRILAQEYKTDYTVEYFLNRSESGLTTHVNFAVKTTNLRSDIYVKKFSLSFPKSFQISNVKANDDEGNIEPKLSTSEQSINIGLEFSNPKLGKNSTNTMQMTFDQSNLFQINGNVWEVILPTIENRGEGTYQVIVNLPDSDKKISISKPKPDKIEGNKIYWNNPTGKTIYAVFGSLQNFDLNLSYHLQNAQLTPVHTEIAFPPDTAHQRIFVNSIEPSPNSIHLDQDGNYIGRYHLKPKETKTIQFDGGVQLFINPRDDVRITDISRMKKQERYLLNETEFWKVSNPERFKQLKSPKDIYNFIVQNFKYNFNRIAGSKSFGRLGADTALQKPDQAICVEFTDTFIALAREQGIKSREVQGYAVTQNPSLRPLSLVKDVLHAWPEYYDPVFQSWIQVDPTWENTSGIDYFSSFDLNHIAFVIHGKNSTQPLPAGMYKTADTRDVVVQTTTSLPNGIKKLLISNIALDKTLNDTTPTKGKITVKNEGNVFVYNIPVQITGENINAILSTASIEAIAPFEERNIDFTLQSLSRNKFKTVKVNVKVGDFDSRVIDVKVAPYSYSVGLGIGIISILVFGTLLLFLRSRKGRRNVK